MNLTGLEKKKHFSGSGNYYRQETAHIMYQIKKANIKHTDGLEKIVAYSFNIQDNLPTDASLHFIYMIKTLSNIRKNAPNAFKGATANPSQMKHVATLVVKDAVYSNQDDNCIFTMLEVLANSIYSLTDSSIRSGVKEADANIFKGTSFGSGIFGSILGATLNIGARAVFEGANLAKNAAKRINCTFSEDEQNKIVQELKTYSKTKDQIIKYLQFYNLCV
ncbi:hypothetical protein FACS1894177_06230 [Bacteroidia bacterium]|nr:hypothetical protein FACS1894177_06230 [Bacteroidia bacterium]